MKYITRQTEKRIKANETALKFRDVVEATQKLIPVPNLLKEIRVGHKFYDELLDYTESQLLKPKVKNLKMYLGSLFGVKIVIDPELKPNEYKIVKENDSLRCRWENRKRR
jgi:hypothetical protein